MARLTIIFGTFRSLFEMSSSLSFNSLLLVTGTMPLCVKFTEGVCDAQDWTAFLLEDYV